MAGSLTRSVQLHILTLVLLLAATPASTALRDSCSAAPESTKRRVGVVGYGQLGQYLVDKILSQPADFELSFIWNRNSSVIEEDERIHPSKVLQDLQDFDKYEVDLILEVAHPIITLQYGATFLERADYFVGSPTVFANHSMDGLVSASVSGDTKHALYIPSGALWGAIDIQKMAQQGTLGSLSITMAKHPSAFKLYGMLQQKLQTLQQQPGESLLYDGPIRELCSMAPHNVNTIAAAALATAMAPGLGFDGVRARLVTDPSLDAHRIDIEIEGNRPPGGEQFTVSTRRYNPAVRGAVTGNGTYSSFWSSVLQAAGQRNGLHFC